MKPEDFELTLEQAFNHAMYTTQVSRLSKAELEQIVLDLTKQLMVKNNMLIKFMKQTGL